MRKQILRLQDLLVNDISNDYGLCNNMDLLLDYCGANLNCKWVGDYLAQLVHEGIDNVPNDFPSK